MAVANIMTSLPLKERLRHPQEIKDEKEAEQRRKEKREALLQMSTGEGTFISKHNEAIESGFLAGRLKKTMAEQQEKI